MIFPNPTSGIVKITTKEFVDISDIYLTDLIGNTVMQIQDRLKSEGSINIDLTEVPEGIYFVTICTANNLVKLKLIKK
ncbi:MAG: T9SS type A sorting domain-containing protein [Cytophagaceae bacterium]